MPKERENCGPRSNSFKVAVGRDGQDQETFTVDESLLRGHSQYFSNALNGNWKESDTRVVPLSDDSPDAFRLYLQIISQSQLTVDTVSPRTADSVGEVYASWAEVFVLAEKIGDIKTKSIIMTSFVREQSSVSFVRLAKYSRDSFMEIVCIIYEGTSDPCPIKTLLVDCFIICQYEEWALWKDFIDQVQEEIPEFLKDLTHGLLVRRDSKSPFLHPEDYCESDQWLYTDKLIFDFDDDVEVQDIIKRFASTFMLGEKVQDEDFCQAVSCKFALVEKAELGGIRVADYINILYENTTPGCNLRNFWVDGVYLLRRESLFGLDFAVEFLRDFAKRSCGDGPENMRELRLKYWGDFRREDVE